MRTSQTVVTWTVYRVDDMRFWLAASDAGLCYIGLPHSDEATMMGFLQKHYPGAQITYVENALPDVRQQLDEYFAGTRTEFDVTLDFHGTPFQVSVWRALMGIPYGELRCYQDVAMAIGNAKAVRAVGTANGQNPLPIVVPCHRVIGSDGTLTGYRGGLRLKERLLNLEGVRDYRVAGHVRFAF